MQHELTELIIMVADDERRVSLSHDMLRDAAPIISNMDSDMSNGWNLGPAFIPSPNRIQRCQIAANRLLTALHTNNEASVSLMAAYILSTIPETGTVVINIEGEAEETLFYDHNHSLISL